VAIDDLSSERALQQLGMEQLGEASPVLRRAPGNLIKALAALLTGDITQAADLFAGCQDTLESKRSEYLLECVIQDLRWLRDKLDELSKSQKEYLETDWVPLLMDADRKARATRARTRIERIARIVCSPIGSEPLPPGDETEEMMRIAMELSDEDVLVLRAVAEAWDHYQHLPAHAMHVVTMPEVKGIPGGSVLGICGKLQSLGLIVNPEVRAKALREGSYPTGGGFVPLKRAEVFLRAIAGHESAPPKDAR